MLVNCEYVSSLLLPPSEEMLGRTNTATRATRSSQGRNRTHDGVLGGAGGRHRDRPVRPDHRDRPGPPAAGRGARGGREPGISEGGRLIRDS